MTVSRRNLLIAGGSAAGLVLLGAGAYQVFKPSRTPTPYDDLLDMLSSREDAAKAGSLMAREIPGDAPALARELRTRLSSTSLADLSAQELSENKLRVIEGWILPDSLALLCALAARVKPV